MSRMHAGNKPGLFPVVSGWLGPGYGSFPGTTNARIPSYAKTGAKYPGTKSGADTRILLYSIKIK